MLAQGRTTLLPRNTRDRSITDSMRETSFDGILDLKSSGVRVFFVLLNHAVKKQGCLSPPYPCSFSTTVWDAQVY